MVNRILKLAFCIKLAAASAVAVILASAAVSLFKGGRAPGPLPHDAYVWQRNWTPAVKDAVRGHSAAFGEICVLAAEVVWRNGKPEVHKAKPDFATLSGAAARIGLAIRIGPFSGPFSETDEACRTIGDLCKSSLAAAEADGAAVSEIQLDFDCPESKLDGYRIWVEAIRERISPTPLVITALPCWLKHKSFKRLAKSAGSYVLQAHSLERPSSMESKSTLCDARGAWEAVEKAGRIGVPFRVALPTYGYTAYFNPAGKFAGVSAEAPPQSRDGRLSSREISTDPGEMAELVAKWTKDRPKALKGIIWYRLPVEGDKLNWPWETLACIMDGKVPEIKVEASARYPEPGLVEADIVNLGNADCLGPVELEMQWGGAKIVAADTFNNAEIIGNGDNILKFRIASSAMRLRPEQKMPFCWARFDRDTEVQIKIFPDGKF